MEPNFQSGAAFVRELREAFGLPPQPPLQAGILGADERSTQDFCDALLLDLNATREDVQWREEWLTANGWPWPWQLHHLHVTAD